MLVAIRDRLIEVIPTIDQFDGDTACLIDGRRSDPDVVICATGYLHGLEPLVGHLGVLGECALVAWRTWTPCNWQGVHVPVVTPGSIG